MNWSDERDRVYRWMRRALLGPPERLDDTASVNHLVHIKPPELFLTRIKPLERFQTGILFPVATDDSGLDPADDDVDDDAEVGLIAADIDKTPALSAAGRSKRRIVPPSSVGFSFFVQGSSLAFQLIPRAVYYELPSNRDRGDVERWQRKTLGSEAHSLTAPPAGSAKVRMDMAVFDEKARLDVVWRARSDGWLVTVSLSNTQHLPKDLPAT